MAIRWCDKEQEARTPKEQKVALWSYYMTFYQTVHGREVLADMRRIIEDKKSKRQSAEDAIECMALDDLLKLIRSNAGVHGEYVTVEAEQKVAVLKIPEDGRPEIDAFEHFSKE